MGKVAGRGGEDAGRLSERVVLESGLDEGEEGQLKGGFESVRVIMIVRVRRCFVF